MNKRSIEARFGDLDRRIRTLYNRAYARTSRTDRQRRRDAEISRLKSQVLRWQNVFAKDRTLLARIGYLVSGASRGKNILMLDRREYLKLKNFLRRGVRL